MHIVCQLVALSLVSHGPLAAWGVTRTTWTVLWILLGASTVLLAWLLRTRWRRVKPWRKCAVLSLWVHVLLACLATTVRIVSGAAGLGPDEPIQISVMQSEAQPCPLAEPAPPEPWEETDDRPPVEPPTPPLPELVEEQASTDAESTPDLQSLEQVVSQPTDRQEQRPPAPPLEAPGLLDTPSPTPLSETPAEASAVAADAPPEEEVVETAEPVVEQAPLPQPPRPVVPSELAARFAENRAELARQGGGNAHTEQAVRSALAWLAGAQAEDGRWDASRHGAGHERVVLGHDRQGAGQSADAGVTGLALLAFLGSGQTHREGAYTRQVADGLEYLCRVQSPDGALHGQAQFFARMYCHSMAAFALGEAWAVTQDPQLRPVVQAALGYTLASQHPSDGGWRYRPGNTGDTSQLGWQLMALHSAELAGEAIPEATWTRVERFLRRVRRGVEGGLAAYRPEAPPSRSMTAEAWYCRQLLATRYRSFVATLAANEARASVLRTLPSREAMNLYYWYYATLALHHARQESPEAAAAWQQWNEALTHALLTTQQEDGSWAASTVWGGYGGRVYTTAMAALCLEVYYRYAPAPPARPAVADRPWQSVR